MPLASFRQVPPSFGSRRGDHESRILNRWWLARLAGPDEFSTRCHVRHRDHSTCSQGLRDSLCKGPDLHTTYLYFFPFSLESLVDIFGFLHISAIWGSTWTLMRWVKAPLLLAPHASRTRSCTGDSAPIIFLWRDGSNLTEFLDIWRKRLKYP